MNIFTRVPRQWNSRARHVLLGGAALTGLLIAGSTGIQAQQPSPPAATTAEGIVHNFTNAPRGEVDGAVLDSGVRLHWPPHMQNRFKDILVNGDQIRAIGRTEVGPGGDTRFEVQTVINLRSNARAENPDFGAAPVPGPRVPRVRMAPPIPPGPEPPAVGAVQRVRTITGTVRNLNTAPRGEIDGVVLDDGVLVHWPPHMQDQFRSLVAVGDPIQATGRIETGPAGDTHFEVQSVTNLRSNQTVTNPDFAGAPAGPGFAPPAAPGEIPASLETRLRNIENRLDQIQRDIARLRESRT